MVVQAELDSVKKRFRHLCSTAERLETENGSLKLQLADAVSSAGDAQSELRGCRNKMERLEQDVDMLRCELTTVAVFVSLLVLEHQGSGASEFHGVCLDLRMASQHLAC